jgi:hypothetical protein
VPVRGDRRNRRGQARAVRQPGLDPRRDPVEPLALDLLEQALEEGAQLAVVGEGDAGDPLDPLAAVAKDPARAVDHPLLRVRVGEHRLRDRAEPDQVVAQLARELREPPVPGPLRAGELRRAQPRERLLDQALGVCAPRLARQVDLLGDERTLDRVADRLVVSHARHGSATSSLARSVPSALPAGSAGKSRLRAPGRGRLGSRIEETSPASERV